MRCKNFLIPVLGGITLLIFVLSFQYFTNNNSSWQQPSDELSTKSNMRNIGNIVEMLQSIDFEVFGMVQGVFFRKYTREKGKQLGLKGWVMNTSQGTVVGAAQGKEEQIEEMKDWLRHTGSPMSKIEKAVFKNERHISKEEFTDFFIKKGSNFY